MSGRRSGLPTQDGTRSAALRALASPRFELVPVSGVDEQAGYLPAGATVTVTCSPARGVENTLEVATRLASRGLRLIPHISARQVRDREHLVTILRTLTEAGIRDIFVIGGDVLTSGRRICRRGRVAARHVRAAPRSGFCRDRGVSRVPPHSLQHGASGHVARQAGICDVYGHADLLRYGHHRSMAIAYPGECYHSAGIHRYTRRS